MGRLVEDLFDMMNNLEDNDDVQAVASPTYKKAVEDNEQIRKELPKKFKDFKKSADEFVKKNHNKELKPKGSKGMKKMKLSESMFEAVATVDDDLYYKSTRGSLRDVMEDEISEGEVVYRLTPEGRFVATNAPSLNIPYDEVGGDEDTIIVHATDEDEAAAVVAMAKKYDRDAEISYDRFLPGNRKYIVTIHMDISDWDGHHYDPNVKIRPDNRGRKKHEEEE